MAVTFNSGTTLGLPHDAEPDDGYTSEQAAISDEWYGDGLAWRPAIQATRAFFDEVSPDIVVFQEVFSPDQCSDIPVALHKGWACEGWSEGDPTVVQQVLGDSYQVACHVGKSDKCAAVNEDFGRFAGCDAALCMEGLYGSTVDGCGRGARVARGVIERTNGSDLTLVNLHGSSGLTADDKACRTAQFEQVFVDVGDGEAAANGKTNLVMGDLNTDPGRFVDVDESAAAFVQMAGVDFAFHTDLGPEVTPTYQGLVNIDHVLSDGLTGGCWTAGVSEGHDDVYDAVYFDHKPVVCELALTGGR